MLPKEHGAYGQLLFPLVTAIAMGTVTPAAIALVITALAVFLVHEPAAVLLGARGPRARRESGRRAWQWLSLFTAVALTGGLAVLWTLAATARWTLAVPAAAAGLALSWSLRGQERTTGGEVAAGVALSAAAFPVAVAAGVPLPVAAACVVAFASGTVAATLSVRALMGRARRMPSTPPRWLAASTCVMVLIISGGLAMGGAIHSAGFWGALPMTAAAFGVALAAPPPQLLRRVGWTFIAATAVGAAVLVLVS